MPIASSEVYAEMLDRAKAGAFAYPAINVTSSQTLNAALRGFADAESDGIIQVSTGGAEYLITQPIFEIESYDRFMSRYEALHGPLNLPVLVGLMAVVLFSVTMMIDSSEANDLTAMIAVTLSSFSFGRRFASERPFDARPASGIS